MVTRNWYNGLKSQTMGVVIPNGYTQVGGTKQPTSSESNQNAAYNIIWAFRQRNFTLKISGGFSPGIIVGSGTTPPTIDDYKLESMITAGLSASVVAQGTDSYIRILTITNTSDHDITISEIGTLGVGYYNQSTSFPMLVDRTVLDTPVTIPAGGIGKIEYEIKINLPIDEA